MESSFLVVIFTIRDKEVGDFEGLCFFMPWELEFGGPKNIPKTVPIQSKCVFKTL